VPVPFAKLSEQKDGESSAVIRARVVAARAYDRILKAITYRNLDKAGWAN